MMIFDESYGPMPQSTRSLIRTANVSPADWEGMLNRWGYSWGDEELPWVEIENHIRTHSQSGRGYSYPMYG